MSQQKVVIVLFLSAFLSSFVSAQYGSSAGSGNVGYGGTGTSVPSGDYGHKGQDSSSIASGADGNSEPEPFNFSYQVKDEPTYNDFKHAANSDGKTVTGEYSVLLPDGRSQIVTYTADENGYNAKVNYVGEAKPQPAQSANAYKSAPSYPSSAPSYSSSAAGGYSSGGASYTSSAPSGYSSGGAGYSSSASGGYSSVAPSYPSSAPSGYPSAPPSYSAGIKNSYAAPQPKNGGY